MRTASKKAPHDVPRGPSVLRSKILRQNRPIANSVIGYRQRRYRFHPRRPLRYGAEVRKGLRSTSLVWSEGDFDERKVDLESMRFAFADIPRPNELVTVEDEGVPPIALIVVQVQHHMTAHVDGVAEATHHVDVVVLPLRYWLSFDPVAKARSGP